MGKMEKIYNPHKELNYHVILLLFPPSEEELKRTRQEEGEYDLGSTMKGLTEIHRVSPFIHLPILGWIRNRWKEGGCEKAKKKDNVVCHPSLLPIPT